MDNEIIKKLNQLLGANLGSVLNRISGHEEAVDYFFKKNKELFDKKIKQLTKKYGSNNYNDLLRDQLYGIENRLADIFQNKSLYNHGDQKEILDFIFLHCPKDLKYGYYIKDLAAKKILISNPPQSLINFLQCQSVDELFEKMSALDIITISRYTEIPKWQEDYKNLLAKCTVDDFEERAINFVIFDYEKYKSILGNSSQPNKPWRLSHNKVTGNIMCFALNNQDIFKTPFIQCIAVFVHYYFETAYAGKYYTIIAKSDPNNLSRAVLCSFTNHDGKFDFFGPNVYSETVYWQEAIKFLKNEFDIPELDFFTDTVYCADFNNNNLVSLNLIDQIWDANLENGPFLYHFKEAAWKNIFQRSLKISDEVFSQEIINHLDMRDVDFTNYIIKKYLI